MQTKSKCLDQSRSLVNLSGFEDLDLKGRCKSRTKWTKSQMDRKKNVKRFSQWLVREGLEWPDRFLSYLWVLQQTEVACVTPSYCWQKSPEKWYCCKNTCWRASSVHYQPINWNTKQGWSFIWTHGSKMFLLGFRKSRQFVRLWSMAAHVWWYGDLFSMLWNNVYLSHTRNDWIRLNKLLYLKMPCCLLGKRSEVAVATKRDPQTRQWKRQTRILIGCRLGSTCNTGVN